MATPIDTINELIIKEKQNLNAALEQQKLANELKIYDELRDQETVLVDTVNKAIEFYNNEHFNKLELIQAIKDQDLTQLGQGFIHIELKSKINQITAFIQEKHQASQEQIHLIELLDEIADHIHDNLIVENLDNDINKMIIASGIDTLGKTPKDFLGNLISFNGLCSNQQLLTYVCTKIQSLQDGLVVDQDLISKAEQNLHKANDLLDLYAAFPSMESNSLFAQAYRNYFKIEENMADNEKAILDLNQSILELEQSIAVIEDCYDLLRQITARPIEDKDKTLEEYFAAKLAAMDKQHKNLNLLQNLKAELKEAVINIPSVAQIDAVQKANVGLVVYSCFNVPAAKALVKINYELRHAPVENRKQAFEKALTALAVLKQVELEADTCETVLEEIQKHSLGDRDLGMRAFVLETKSDITALGADLNKMQALKLRLVSIRDALNTSTEVQKVQKAISNLEKRNHWYTRGVGEKAKKIDAALLSSSVEERATILSSTKTNDVQRALAARRPVFFGGIENAKETDKGIVLEKAAKTYQEVVKAIKV